MIDEVIAYKSKKTRIVIIFLLDIIIFALMVVWAVMITILHFDKQLAVQLGVPPLWVTILYFLFGSGIIIFSAFFSAYYFRLPQIMIYRSGDKICFIDKLYDIVDIDRIDYREIGYCGLFSTLKIILKDGKVLKNLFIGDLYSVNLRLHKILFIYKEMRNDG